jgi:hypothetical protein
VRDVPAIRALGVALAAAGLITSCTDDEPPTVDGVGVGAALRELDCAESDRFEGAERRTVFECSVDDAPVLIHVPSAEDHQQYVKYLEGRYAGPSEFSACPGEPFPDGFRVVDAEAWVAVAATPDAAAEVVRRIGGTVQPTPHGGGPPYSYPHPALDCDD